MAPGGPAPGRWSRGPRGNRRRGWLPGGLAGGRWTGRPPTWWQVWRRSGGRCAGVADAPARFWRWVLATRSGGRSPAPSGGRCGRR